MDVNQQNGITTKETATDNMAWVPSKHSNLLIPRQKKQRNLNREFFGRSLWDWMNLFGVLAIPFVVAAGTLYFTQQITLQQTQLSDIATRQQHQTDLQIASDQQQEATLQTYLDRLSVLLLDRNLHSSKPGDEVRNVARAQTLIVLPRLDAVHKGLVILFLYESGLITGTERMVDLVGADLSGITLSPFIIDTFLNKLMNTVAYTELNWVNHVKATKGTDISPSDFSPINLGGINLHGTNLYKADLQGMNLYEADLSEAKLDEANLSGANMSRINLSAASLSGANMSYVYLNQANLTGTDLQGANLKNAEVTNEQFANTFSLQGATMPDGSIHP